MPREARAPAPLFEESEAYEEYVATAPEKIKGEIEGLIGRQDRLIALLQEAPVRSTKAVLLERARWSAEKFADQLAIELRRHRAAAWTAER